MSSHGRGRTGTRLSLLGLLCACGVLGLLGFVYSGGLGTSEGAGILAAWIGFLAVTLLPLPGCILSLGGLIYKRSKLAWLSLGLSFLPFALLGCLLGAATLVESIGTRAVEYSYDELKKDEFGVIKRVSGGSHRSKVPIIFGRSAQAPRDGGVHAFVVSSSRRKAVIRIYWPNGSAKEIELAVGESSENWDESEAHGMRIRLTSIERDD